VAVRQDPSDLLGQRNNTKQALKGRQKFPDCGPWSPSLFRAVDFKYHPFPREQLLRDIYAILQNPTAPSCVNIKNRPLSAAAAAYG
jgi:hypothetical protein